MLSVLIKSSRVHTTYNFMIKLENVPKYLFSYRKHFVGTQKCVRIIQGKRAIGVQVIQVLMHTSTTPSKDIQKHKQSHKTSCKTLTSGRSYGRKDGQMEERRKELIFYYILSHTVDTRYLEFHGTLWNSSRYPYFDISDLQNWGKTNSINHI